MKKNKVKCYNCTNIYDYLEADNFCPVCGYELGKKVEKSPYQKRLLPIYRKIFREFNIVEDDKRVRLIRKLAETQEDILRRQIISDLTSSSKGTV